MTRPKPPCGCIPWKAPYGSGYHWTHSRWCVDYPNQRIGEERSHPAGNTPERQWVRSPLIGPMDYWASYFDDNLDDEDDERKPEGAEA